MHSRTKMLIGESGIAALKNSSVLVLGIGGVGSYTAEALARAGIGKIGICDADFVSASNINRQLYALNSTVGLKKTFVAKNRILDINPCANVEEYDFFFDSNSLDRFDLSMYDYIVDAIDSMESKVLLITEAHKMDIPIVSALSAGNKMDPGMFEVADIFSTSVCPIAKILRRKLKDAGVTHHKVIYSKETPVKPYTADAPEDNKKMVGSISFVPSVMGLLLAGEVIKDLLERENNG